jgi:hypothetical protein
VPLRSSIKKKNESFLNKSQIPTLNRGDCVSSLLFLASTETYYQTAIKTSKKLHSAACDEHRLILYLKPTCQSRNLTDDLSQTADEENVKRNIIFLGGGRQNVVKIVGSCSILSLKYKIAAFKLFFWSFSGKGVFKNL